MSKPTTKVLCSVCGKTLRGTETPVGFSVVAHTLPRATDEAHKPAWALPKCSGANRLDHRPIPN